MSFDGSGNYSKPNTRVTPAVSGTTIESDEFNTWTTDVKNAFNTCFARDGQATATGNFKMGTYKITGMGDAAAAQDAATAAQVVSSELTYEGTETGSADAYAISPPIAITAYAAGQRFSFVPANDNTGASTLAVSGLTAKNIKLVNGDDPAAGDIDASGVAEVIYDGTNFVLLSIAPNNPSNNTVYDANGNELLEFGTTASALNNIKITNKGTGVDPVISAEGESNIGLVFHDSNGNIVYGMFSNAGASNYLYSNNSSGAVTIGSASATSSNIDINLTPKGTGVVAIAQGDLEVGSTPVYGLVVLDTPVELESGSAVVGSWTQHDMSLGNGSAAATAGASKAILRAHITVNESSAGQTADTAVYAQKNSLGGANDLTNTICSCRAVKDSTADASSKSTAEVIVNLDSNSDFEFQVASGGSSLSYNIYLVGYYV